MKYRVQLNLEKSDAVEYSFIAKKEGKIIGACIGSTVKTITSIPENTKESEIHNSYKAKSSGLYYGRPGAPQLKDYPNGAYLHFVAVDSVNVGKKIGEYLFALHLCSAVYKKITSCVLFCGHTYSCRLAEKWYTLI